MQPRFQGLRGISAREGVPVVGHPVAYFHFRRSLSRSKPRSSSFTASKATAGGFSRLP